ncbi:hypothetical protein [Polaromonas eurypsychrophila]|uniref:hypothetical protein n=1 Tax=Polaromonas eurypsychrophila TaxID=1614635 RepID=UPI001E518B40|nr:hypothetical protein [Polaromonas eurypsychrophila]
MREKFQTSISLNEITMYSFSALRVLTTTFAVLALHLSVSLSALAQVDESKLVPEKKTKLELYLDAKSTPDFLKKMRAVYCLLMCVLEPRQCLLVCLAQ